MKALDREFLEDWIRFGYMNRIVAATSFYNAWLHAHETAIAVQTHVGEFPAENLPLTSDNYNDVSRIQKILIAKLMVEFAAAVEEFGSLCEAIQKREQYSIFSRFIDGFHHDEEFFDRVLNNPQVDLPQLLLLPTANELAQRLGEEYLSIFDESYRAKLFNIKFVAGLWQTWGSLIDSDDVSPDGQLPLPPYWRESINVILAGPGKLPALLKRRSFTSGTNKIKHRFAVIESLETLLAAAAEGPTLPYTCLNPDLDGVHQFFQNTVRVARSTGAVAELILFLDDQGLLP